MSIRSPPFSYGRKFVASITNLGKRAYERNKEKDSFALGFE